MLTLERLKLERPLFWFDLETTSVNVNSARIVQLAFIRYTPGKDPASASELFNPGVKIPEDAVKTHGITNERVKDCRAFKDVAEDLAKYIKDCDFGGYNVRYDLNVLTAEFKRCDIAFDYSTSRHLDPLRIWQKLEPKELKHAVKRWAPGFDFKAHDAEGDIAATVEVFEGMIDQLSRVIDGDLTVENIHEFVNPNMLDMNRCFVLNEKGEVVVNFGNKHRGELAKNCIPYLKWMLSKDFKEDTLDVCRAVIQDAQK